MPKLIRLITAFLALLPVCLADASRDVVIAAEAKPTWQVEWDRTVKAAEDEGAVVLYVTGAFEPVFREAFQKRFPKIKVTLVIGRGPDMSQRIMSERRAEKFAVDLYIGGNISPITVFHKAKILEPVRNLLVLPEVLDTLASYEGKHHYDDLEDKNVTVLAGGTPSRRSSSSWAKSPSLLKPLATTRSSTGWCAKVLSTSCTKNPRCGKRGTKAVRGLCRYWSSGISFQT